MNDLRDVWQSHEDPSGYRVEYVYGENGSVVALRLTRLTDETIVGEFTNVDALLTAAGVPIAPL